MKLIRNILSAGNYLIHANSMVNAKTYFPEKRRKNKVRIFFEQFAHSLKYGELYRYYYVYGMDVVGRSDSSYLDYCSFVKLRNNLNMSQPYNYVCVLRDKKLFGTIASAYGFQSASEVGAIIKGVPSKPIEHLLEKNHHLFCKPVDSTCGRGVFELQKVNDEYLIDSKVVSKESLLEFVKDIKEEIIIQPFIEQHKEISNIYDKSINSIRIVTINPKKSTKPDDVVVLGALLRIGANGLNVDNWARGGIVVGIDEKGTLMRYGFYKPGYGTKTEKHPNSGFVFEGYKIPFFNELKKQVKTFHSKICGIHSIGWDVAITNNGPLFIEGNDDYELGFLQTCFGGMRSYFDKYFKNQK